MPRLKLSPDEAELVMALRSEKNIWNSALEQALKCVKMHEELFGSEVNSQIFSEKLMELRR